MMSSASNPGKKRFTARFGEFSAIALATCTFFGGPSAVWSAVITDPSQFGTTDYVGWSALAPNNTSVPDPFTQQINSGLSVLISTARPGTFYLSTQGAGWKGNFPTGDNILWNHDLGPVTFQFSAPIGGMGLYVQNDNYGTFVASYYDAGGDLIGQTAGTANRNNDGSAPFFGVLDATPDISTVVLTTGVSNLGGLNGDANNFAFDALNVNAVGSGVPEPASAGTVLGLIAGTLICRRRRSACR